MKFYHKNTHKDQIWSAAALEIATQNTIIDLLEKNNYKPLFNNNEINHGLPNVFEQNNKKVIYRFVDSLLLNHSEIQTWNDNDIAITDSYIRTPLHCQVVNMFPEFWHIWYVNFSYTERPPLKKFNFFSNRISGDRTQIFYELVKRNLLNQSFISFNCFIPGNNRNNNDTVDYSQVNLEQQYHQADLYRYATEHQHALKLVPYNTVESHGSLEDCIIDSEVSLIAETYISDCETVFSEKIFRSLQLPRPWLLYSSPGAVTFLKGHGFDVLEDIIDHSYDLIQSHSERLMYILDYLENLKLDYSNIRRYKKAAMHNQQLLLSLKDRWPNKLNQLEKIIC